jgi:hypothetical protein
MEESRRISDHDRERAVLALRDDLLAGRLTLDEFSERVEIAYGARMTHDLVRVRQDLPDSRSANIESGRRHKRLTVALFGRVVRRGRLRLRRRTLVISCFGDVDLDLREAELHDSRVVVRLTVLSGNVDLYVPEGINVEVDGVVIFGRLREWGRDVIRLDAPRFRFVRSASEQSTFGACPMRRAAATARSSRNSKHNSGNCPPDQPCSGVRGEGKSRRFRGRRLVGPRR